eukprot:6873968-Lingulodinium_polyedra.AAC.1
MAKRKPAGAAPGGEAKKAQRGGKASLRSWRGCGVAPTDAWLDTSLKKVIRLVFKNFSEAEIHGVQVQEKTLWQRLRDDKIQWCLKGSLALSGPYYDDLKHSYRMQARPIDKLKVRNDLGENSKDPDERLLRALSMLEYTRPCRARLGEYVKDQCKALTQRAPPRHLQSRHC